MTATEGKLRRRRKWLGLGVRVLRLLWAQQQTTGEVVQSSYDKIAGGYDEVWTDHMRDLTDAMLARLSVRDGDVAVDLTCGTGYLSGKLLGRGAGAVVGVDASAGMVRTARGNYPGVEFVHADALEYLRNRPGGSVDVVTCGWGLGYCSPRAVLGEIRRVLRPGGRVAIIDNSLFSLAGVLWASFRAFAEYPDALQHVMKVKFLPHSIALAVLMRSVGLGLSDRGDGARAYHAPDGQAALARLRATGAAAGFEFAASPEQTDTVFGRFAEIIKDDCAPGPVRIVHRYLWALGVRS
jgi:ubiquinone/menaquinone biosynthesis C-methylase UbiE